MTWSNRENEWYNSERRLIFACTSNFERERWIRHFQRSMNDNVEKKKKRKKSRKSSKKRTSGAGASYIKKKFGI